MFPPPLDLALFTGGNNSQSQQFASKLLDALDEHGFVKIVGHGIPKSELEVLFACVSITDILF